MPKSPKIYFLFAKLTLWSLFLLWRFFAFVRNTVFCNIFTNHILSFNLSNTEEASEIGIILKIFLYQENRTFQENAEFQKHSMDSVKSNEP